MSRIGYPFTFLLRCVIFELGAVLMQQALTLHCLTSPHSDILQYDNTLEDAMHRITTANRTCDLILGIGDGKVRGC